MKRRQFVQRVVAGLLANGLAARGRGADASPFPTRVLTKGPKHHWFGYYDKLQFDPTGRYVLGMEVDFEHRSPSPDDVIRIGMIDLQDSDRWTELGKSTAWNWQQGCMLQWLPGSSSEVLWNERSDDAYVCRILDVFTGKSRIVPHSIYAVHPNGKTAVTTDFRRLGDVRPGYGYNGIADPYASDPAPQESGIWSVDLESGQSKLVLSVAEIAKLGQIPKNEPGVKHYFNHLLFNPDGSRFIALHRWQYRDGHRLTRMITANPDGSDVRIVVGNGYASHFIWRDPQHILCQSRSWLGNDNWGNFLFEDKDGGGEIEEIGRGVLDPSGHLSYLPGNEWILCDTYPKGAKRLQTPHLYHIASGCRLDLGHFPAAARYAGEWRVDTHPRLSPDSRFVCIDSPDGDSGRQMFLIDIQRALEI